MNKRIFFTGGSGFVGQGSIPKLIKAGYEVYALARSSTSAALIGLVGAIPVQDDLTNLSTATADALKKCDIVIHSAAYMAMDYDYDTAYQINVQATENLLQLAKENNVKHFIFISAAPVVPGSPIVKLKEKDAKDGLPIHAYPKTKAIAEQKVLQANAKNFRTISLRPPLIWGKGNHHMEEVFDRVKADKWMWIGGGKQILSTIHVENLATAIIAAIESDKGGQAYFVTDGDNRTMRTTLEAIIKAHGLDGSNKEFPLSFADALGNLFHHIWTLFNLKSQPPIPALVIRLMAKEFSVDDSKARKELSYKNAISFDEGIAQMRA